MNNQNETACTCKSWCRADLCGQMINGHKYPAPNHADGCPAQVRERFIRVSYGNASCVVEPHEADTFSEDLLSDKYTFTEVMLTRDQFERMDEFTGF